MLHCVVYKVRERLLQLKIAATHQRIFSTLYAYLFGHVISNMIMLDHVVQFSAILLWTVASQKMNVCVCFNGRCIDQNDAEKMIATTVVSLGLIQIPSVTKAYQFATDAASSTVQPLPYVKP